MTKTFRKPSKIKDFTGPAKTMFLLGSFIKNSLRQLKNNAVKRQGLLKELVGNVRKENVKIQYFYCSDIGKVFKAF